MNLFFNWNTLVKETKGDPTKLLELFEAFHSNKILRQGLRTKLIGSSYLVNPIGFINDSSTDILHKYQYLLLAAKRDYTLYKLYGVKYLPLAQYSDINCNLIKHNPILKIQNQNIYFKYEELKNGTIV